MRKERDTLAAALGLRWWRQAERRAVADYERWTGQTLRRLAVSQTPVLDASAAGWPPGTPGVVSLTLPGWQVLLAGVAPGPRRALLSQAPLHLDAAGRYGRFWWLQVVAGRRPGADQKIVLLGSRLCLVRGGDGHDRGLSPAGAMPAATAPGRFPPAGETTGVRQLRALSGQWPLSRQILVIMSLCAPYRLTRQFAPPPSACART